MRLNAHAATIHNDYMLPILIVCITSVRVAISIFTLSKMVDLNRLT